MITRREGASGPLAPTPGDATGEATMENRRATGPDQNVVNLACSECCAWADQVKTLRANAIAELRLSRIEELSADLHRARAEIRDLERENASLRRRLREGGR